MQFVTENYHSHTYRCQHATGTEREYIEAAIEMGIKTLGFSDHVPCPYKTDYVSGIRMTWEQADEYVAVIRKLQEEYADRIKILVGFEAEYIPEFFQEQCEMFDRLKVDYVILGAHFLESEEDGQYTGHPTASVEFLKQYVDSCLEGMATGRFMYLAHPDLINFIGDEKVYEAEMKRLCLGLKEMGKPVECNMLGYAGNRHYPSKRFWKIVKETGAPYIIGVDAHSVADMKNVDAYNGVVELCK